MDRINKLIDYSGTTENTWLNHQLIKLKSEIQEEREILVACMEALREWHNTKGNAERSQEINLLIKEYKEKMLHNENIN